MFGKQAIQVLATIVALTVTGASANPFTWATDPTNDHTGPSSYSIHGIGYRIEGNNLEVAIRTNFPQAGDPSGTTSYGNEHILPGDLYINVGGSYTAGTGSAFGLGMTNHSGDVTSDPNDNGLAWLPVQAGYLYSNAHFVTGTYEEYPNAGTGGSPWDGGLDPYGNRNNLPTMIADYGNNLGYQGPVAWNSVSGQPWQYVVTASVGLADLGLLNGGDFELWWSMSCGNDAVMINGTAPPVPEPATAAVLSLGLLGYLRRRRQTV